MCRSVSFVFSLLILTALAGCGKSPAAPCTDCQPVATLVFTQPADIRFDNVHGGSMVVTYPTPATTGGTAPITVTCSPASGSAFAVGTVTVTCRATDSAGRSAETRFNVMLVAFVPVLQATTFLAVGDSVTLGENGDNSEPDHCTSSGSTFAIRPQFVDTCHTYPFLLNQKLTATYTSQTPMVFVDAMQGRHAREVLTGLPGDLMAYRPDALLLMAGFNDLPANFGDAIANLRGCIELAKSFGVKEVFISNLTPNFNSSIEPVTGAFNNSIRALADAQHVVLVDNFAAFMAVGNYRTLIEGADLNHLHPNSAGYQVMADTFFAAIQARFDVPSANVTISRVRR
jgi:lysophospholipase L1-like esterase